MGILEKIPNLRKVSMSPFINIDEAVANVGDRYVFSYKPNPAVFAETTWNLDKARHDLETVPRQGEGTPVRGRSDHERHQHRALRAAAAVGVVEDGERADRTVRATSSASGWAPARSADHDRKCARWMSTTLRIAGPRVRACRYRKLGEWSRNAMALLEELREAVVDGQAKLAVAKVTEGLDGGIEAGTCCAKVSSRPWRRSVRFTRKVRSSCPRCWWRPAP